MIIVIINHFIKQINKIIMKIIIKTIIKQINFIKNNYCMIK